MCLVWWMQTQNVGKGALEVEDYNSGVGHYATRGGCIDLYKTFNMHEKANRNSSKQK